MAEQQNAEIWDTKQKKKELKLVKETVKLIQIFKDKYKDKFNENTLESMLRTTFPVFVKDYSTLFKMVLKTDNIEYLNIMIDGIMSVCDGKSDIDTVRNSIGEQLAENYLYPIMGKPDKK
jgi:hypothetical protein